MLKLAHMQCHALENEIYVLLRNMELYQQKIGRGHIFPDIIGLKMRKRIQIVFFASIKRERHFLRYIVIT